MSSEWNQFYITASIRSFFNPKYGVVIFPRKNCDLNHGKGYLINID
jgi:hypothetical protein